MDKKIQWHPGFCAAMELEFRENHNDLEYEREYNLGRKPLEADLLVIKKNSNSPMKNKIGEIFCRWNILEYKSPDDTLSIDDFYKVNAYACLFKSQSKTVNGHPAAEITVSLIRQRYPAEMMRALTAEGFLVYERYAGIYEVTGSVLFRTQIIVSRQLQGEEHIWLKSLTNKIEQREFQMLADNIIILKDKGEQECADAVLEVVSGANAEAVDKWREDSIMCETLARIMEPEMSKARAAAEKQGMEQGIAQGIAQGMEQGIAQGMEQGITQGMEQGMVQGIALAKNVLKLQAQGLLPPEIAEKVGIAESEVLHILE